MSIAKRLMSCVVTLLMATATYAQAQTVVYKDPKASTERRVADLLGRMTLEEKVAQLQSHSTIPRMDAAGHAPALMRDGHVDENVAKQILANGIGAFAHVDFMQTRSAADGATQQNEIQRWVLDNTRLGIPVLFQVEALHGATVSGATSFPQAIALGSTWDRPLIKEMFDVVGREARASGMTLALAPVFDLSRDPRFGRVEEMYSEDPYLAGEMGLAAVQGLQGGRGSAGSDHVIATAKHLLHAQPENGTNVGPSDYSERTMRSVFLNPFEKAVKIGKIGAVMSSYNENRGGVPATADSWLLKDVLRDEWGFRGLTVSDWDAVRQLQAQQGVAGNADDAGILAFNAGIDMELPDPTGYPALAAATREGNVSQADLDAAVGRVLTAKFEAGLFEKPFTDVKVTTKMVGAAAHAQLARKVADRAIILLKNEKNILPLSRAAIRNLAVIGPNADKTRLGTYSGKPAYFVTVLDGIRKRAGKDVNVTYAEGVRISEPDSSVELNKIMPYQAPAADKDDLLLAQAVETARAADVVVLVLGGNEAVSREGFGAGLVSDQPSLGDTDALELPGRQNDLVWEIVKLGKPTIAVLLNGRPYSIGALVASVPAIVEGWYLGQETGNAVAGVLFGDVNPSGRLPVTIARNAGQLPVYYYKKPPARLGYVGSSNEPLFPFGFGLSYTNFNYDGLILDKSVMGRNDSAKLSVKITNNGARAGAEVVQVYVRPRSTRVVQPVLRLAEFKRVELEPGKSVIVSFEIGTNQLSSLNMEMKQVVEPGIFDLSVGPNAALLSTVALRIDR